MDVVELTRIEDFSNAQGTVIAALEVSSLCQPVGCFLDAAFAAARAAFNATKAVDYEAAAAIAREGRGFSYVDGGHPAVAIREGLSSAELLAARSDLV
jgi:hypothetical protein